MRMSYYNKNVATEEIIYENFLKLLEFRIGDVRSYADVCSAIQDADLVVNAAALKQVPTCEYFPVQALLTNCIGAANIVRAIQENNYKVDTVIGISTDKACKPINVMGMTKSIHERIFISANILSPSTRFICVRYGNVLASRGSVIPLFHEQIKKGGPLTITDKEMTRFLLSLNDAVDDNKDEIVVWGTGKPSREFIYAKDAAEGILLATEKYDKSFPINIGAGFEITIKELLNLIVSLTNFKGKIMAAFLAVHSFDIQKFDCRQMNLMYS